MDCSLSARDGLTDDMSELRILTVEQVAGLVQLSPRTVMRAIHAGDLEAAELTDGGRGWRVQEPAIVAWLEARSNRVAQRRLADPRLRAPVAALRRPARGSARRVAVSRRLQA